MKQDNSPHQNSRLRDPISTNPKEHGSRLREDYVQPGNLTERAAGWMERLAPLTRHPFRQERLGDKPCLLVMDMQRLFIDESSPAFIPAGRTVTAPVIDLIKAFRKRKLPVIFTRHVDHPNDTRGPMCRWWNHLVKPDDPLSELHPAFVEGSSEIVIRKTQYSAFESTRLEVLLKRLRISSLPICGVQTHLCCDTTARAAFMRGFEVIMVIDAMATLNESLHLGSLGNLVHGFASPALSRDILFGIES